MGYVLRKTTTPTLILLSGYNALRVTYGFMSNVQTEIYSEMTLYASSPNNSYAHTLYNT